MAIDFSAGLRHRNATPAPVVNLTAEAIKAARDTASHPAMRPAMEQATNKPQPVGQEDPESKRPILQPTDNPATNQAIATAEMPAFRAKLEQIIEGIPGANLVATRDAKNPQRMAEKINNEGQPAETISDYGACQVSVDTVAAKDAVVAAVKKSFPVVREKDNFDKGDDDYHFHAVILQVQQPTHGTTELQIIPKEVMEANPEQHHNYKAAREAEISGDDKEFEAQATAAKAKNDSAMQAFLSRNDKKYSDSIPGEGQHKYKSGTTQANLPSGSDAAMAIQQAQQSIPDEHLAGDGKDIDTPHVTVRYGVRGNKLDGLRSYLRKQAPFDATLGKTSIFPPSESSDGAAVIKADVHSPELHRMNAEIAKHGDFAPSSFPDYKPHVTVAYVKPEHVSKHVGNTVTEGKKFRISSVHIGDRDGNKEEVPLGVGQQSNSERKGGREESPEQVGAASRLAVAPALTSNDAPKREVKTGATVRLQDGTRAKVAYSPHPSAPVPMYRLKTDEGKTQHVRGRDIGGVTVLPDEWIGVDLDKTLAHFTVWKGATSIGKPLPAMVDKVKKMLKDGEDVRIFTARIANDPTGAAKKAIEQWCVKNIGMKLPITNKKDSHMKVLYDDRARQVEANTGKVVGPDFSAGLKRRA